jgi:hypothetical protein
MRVVVSIVRTRSTTAGLGDGQERKCYPDGHNEHRAAAQSTTANIWISTSCSGSPNSSTAMLVEVGLWLKGAK